MNKLKNYTVIHGNIMYKVKEVEYESSKTHRRFKRDNELILSVPLNSVMIENGKKISARLLPVTQPPEAIQSSEGTPPAVLNGGSDNFIEGMVTGAIVHEIFFD